jgi:hypothetical protein
MNEQERRGIGPWGKHNLKNKTKVKDEQLEKPISQRLTELRSPATTDPDPTGALHTSPNWDARERELAQQKPTLAKIMPKTQVIATKLGENARKAETKLNEAREAEARRREQIKTDAAKPVQPDLISGAPEIQALLEVWIVRNTEVWPCTPFNMQNLLRLMHEQIGQRVPGWSWTLVCFDAAAKWLAENGYFEPAAHARKRGVADFGMAAREYPEWVEETVETAARTVVVKRDTDLSAEEIAERAKAKAMPFSQLAKEVRKNYAPDPKSTQ